MKKLIAVLTGILLICAAAAVTAEGALSFESQDYEVRKGKTLTLTAQAQEIEGKLTYEWTSSDEEVATVSAKGAVKGVSGGTVTVTCTAKDAEGNEYAASCQVTVAVPVKKITAEESVMTLRQGSETPIICTVEPEDATLQEIEWTSKYGNAVVSEDGIITAVSAGDDIITGTAKDGSGAKVKITVHIPDIYFTQSRITVTEESGADFYYAFANADQLNYTGHYVSGDCFELENIDDVDGMEGYHIKPLKAGTGKVAFSRNGHNIGSVTIVIKDSAVRSGKTYPTLSVKKALADQEGYTGKKVSLQIVKEEGCNAEDSDSPYLFLAYVKRKSTSEAKQYVLIDCGQIQRQNAGTYAIIYGVIDRFTTVTAPDGKEYEVPVIVDVTYDKMST